MTPHKILFCYGQDTENDPFGIEHIYNKTIDLTPCEIIEHRQEMRPRKIKPLEFIDNETGIVWYSPGEKAYLIIRSEIAPIDFPKNELGSLYVYTDPVHASIYYEATLIKYELDKEFSDKALYTFLGKIAVSSEQLSRVTTRLPLSELRVMGIR